MASSASIFVILLVFAFTRSAKQYVRIEKKTWDVMTRTASDYTLEMPISETQLKTFYEQLTDNEQRNFAPMFLLKCKLMEGIESQLRDRLTDEEQKSQVAVADINFKFQNGWLIDLLTKRGEAIKWKDWDALAKVNTQLRHQCTVKRQDLISPTDAFVTFENELTVNLAREKPTVQLFGQTVTLK